MEYRTVFYAVYAPVEASQDITMPAHLLRPDKVSYEPGKYHGERGR